MNKKQLFSFLLLCSSVLFVGCADETPGEEIEKELSEEYYAGGMLGTAFNTTTACFEQPTPAVSNAGMDAAFLRGEVFFDNPFVSELNPSPYPMRGIGPVFIRTSCKHCHPGYGHSRRVDKFDTNQVGNGYLLVIYTTDENGVDKFVPTLTGMPQTKALHPFKAPIDEKKIAINWLPFTDEYGNKYADGTSYDLIYPEVTIPRDAFVVDMPEDYKVRLEATIGIYGSGLLDAIEDQSIRDNHAKQLGKPYEGRIGADLTEADGNTRIKRFTYGLTRATLQNGPGSNAIWNITNVTRPGRTSNYITANYIEKMSTDEEVIANIPSSGYSFLKGADDAETGKNIAEFLGNKNLPVEFEQDDYTDFMIWHRGLAVPAARNLEDEDVVRGKELFYSAKMGCTSCHNPTYTTGNDDYVGDAAMVGKLPRYPNQKIWPYTDMLQHNLDMKNNIRTGWCRTTPLWGRGLSATATGAGDHLHDMRARTYEEAILWHFGQGLYGREKFRNLPKSDRDALVAFLEAI